MKHLALIIFTLFIGSSISQTFTKEDYKEIGARFKKAGVKTIQNSLSAKYDKHTDTYTISSVSLPVGKSYVHFSCNLVKVNEAIKRTSVKIHVNYRASDWIWLESVSATLALTKDSDSSLVVRTKTYLNDPVTDVLSDATIKERAYGTLNKQSFLFYKQIVETGRTISFRFNGEKVYSEKTVLGLSFKSKTKNFFNVLDEFEEI